MKRNNTKSALNKNYQKRDLSPYYANSSQHVDRDPVDDRITIGQGHPRPLKRCNSCLYHVIVKKFSAYQIFTLRLIAVLSGNRIVT